jgi:hypothetical protein
MPKTSKNTQKPARPLENPKLYAHAYANRLAKQVAAELEPTRRADARKKTAPTGR